MTTETEIIHLDRNWQQLTDGANNAFIQAKYGVMEYVMATSLPAPDDEGYTLSGKEITVTAPSQIWARSSSSVQQCRIAMTIY